MEDWKDEDDIDGLWERVMAIAEREREDFNEGDLYENEELK